jgi:hypothetical protein
MHRHTLTSFLAIVVMAATPSGALASESNTARAEAQRRACISHTEASTAALLTHDWALLEKEAARRYASCKERFERITALINIVDAQTKRGFYRSAARNVTKCIEEDPLDPRCRFWAARLAKATGDTKLCEQRKNESLALIDAAINRIHYEAADLKASRSLPTSVIDEQTGSRVENIEALRADWSCG